MHCETVQLPVGSVCCQKWHSARGHLIIDSFQYLYWCYVARTEIYRGYGCHMGGIFVGYTASVDDITPISASL